MSLRYLPLLLAAALLAGCRAEQAVFSFQPGPPAPLTVPTTPRATAAPAALVADNAGRVASPSPEPAGRSLPARTPSGPPASRQPSATYANLIQVPAPATRPLSGWLVRKATKQFVRRAPMDGAAESGLGRTVLTLLAMVLAGLAGLAALLSLIPGVSFWGGLGLAVGGLVVLFLLYKLFSGSKK